jgi:hypothetical protein
MPSVFTIRDARLSLKLSLRNVIILAAFGALILPPASKAAGTAFDGQYGGNYGLSGAHNDPGCAVANNGNVAVSVDNNRFHSTLSYAPFSLDLPSSGKFVADSIRADKGWPIHLTGQIVGNRLELEWGSPYCHYHASLARQAPASASTTTSPKALTVAPPIASGPQSETQPNRQSVVLSQSAQNGPPPTPSPGSDMGNQDDRRTLTLSNGRTYVGDIRDGKANGQGVMTYPDGQEYVGQFLDGQRHGQATVMFPDGRRFVGEYRNDKRNGKGTLTLANGEKYVGEYRNGEKNGQGTSYLANGEVQSSGLWIDGKFSSQQAASVSPPRTVETGPSSPVAPNQPAEPPPSPTSSPPPSTLKLFYSEGRALQHDLSGKLTAKGNVIACDIQAPDANDHPGKQVNLDLGKTFENTRPTLVELMALDMNKPIETLPGIAASKLRIADYVALRSVESVLLKHGIPSVSQWAELHLNWRSFSLTGGGLPCDLVLIDQATYAAPFVRDSSGPIISREDWDQQWLGFAEILSFQSDELAREAKSIVGDLSTRVSKFQAGRSSLSEKRSQFYGMIGFSHSPYRPYVLADSNICSSDPIDGDVATSLILSGEEAIGIPKLPVWHQIPTLDAVYSEAKQGHCDAYFGSGPDVSTLWSGLNRDKQFGVILPIFISSETLMNATKQKQAERKTAADAEAVRQREAQAEYENRQRTIMAAQEQAQREQARERERCLADAECKAAKAAQITAVFSCGDHMPVWVCFIGDSRHVNGSLSIRSGEHTTVYTVQDFLSTMESTQVEIPLDIHFQITAQSTGDGPILNMIIRNGLGKQLYQDQVADYGVIKVKQ